MSLHIHLRNGVFIAQDPHYKEWANIIFPELKKYVFDLDGAQVTEEEENNTIKINEKDEACTSENIIQQTSDIESLWAETESLRKALLCIQEDYKILQNELKDIKSNMAKQAVELESSKNELAHMYDMKCNTFMTTTTSDCQVKIKSQSKVLSDICSNNKTELRNLHDNLQHKVDKQDSKFTDGTMPNSNDIQKLNCRVERMENKLKPCIDREDDDVIKILENKQNALQQRLNQVNTNISYTHTEKNKQNALQQNLYQVGL